MFFPLKKIGLVALGTVAACLSLLFIDAASHDKRTSAVSADASALVAAAISQDQDQNQNSGERAFSAVNPFATESVVPPPPSEITPKQLDETVPDARSSDYPNNTHSEFEYQQWAQAHGYELSDYWIYLSYDDKTLKALMANGDFTAIFALQIRAGMEGDFELFEEYDLVAAAYGSLGALTSKASFSTESAASLSPERFRQRVTDMFLYSEVAAMRGDFEAVGNSLYTIDSLKDSDIEGFQLTPDELQAISVLAQQRYAEIESRRVELGLGPFDNTISSPEHELNLRRIDSYVNLLKVDVHNWGRNIVERYANDSN